MRTSPLGPSEELLVGPRNSVLGGADACERRQSGRRRSSLWGHQSLYWMGRTHANVAIGAFGGALCGATKR
eukprot:4515914-Pyramimonas_sp.AAC.1